MDRGVTRASDPEPRQKKVPNIGIHPPTMTLVGNGMLSYAEANSREGFAREIQSNSSVWLKPCSENGGAPGTLTLVSREYENAVRSTDGISRVNYMRVTQQQQNASQSKNTQKPNGIGLSCLWHVWACLSQIYLLYSLCCRCTIRYRKKNITPRVHMLQHMNRRRHPTP